MKVTIELHSYLTVLPAGSIPRLGDGVKSDFASFADVALSTAAYKSVPGCQGHSGYPSHGNPLNFWVAEGIALDHPDGIQERMYCFILTQTMIRIYSL